MEQRAHHRHHRFRHRAVDGRTVAALRFDGRCHLDIEGVVFKVEADHGRQAFARHGGFDRIECTDVAAAKCEVQ